MVKKARELVRWQNGPYVQVQHLAVGKIVRWLSQKITERRHQLIIVVAAQHMPLGK